jgi:ribosomal protein S18 acetylase RimI-like enzyme
MTEIAIRTATQADLDAILVLWEEMVQYHCDVEPDIWAMNDEARGYARQYLQQMLVDENSRIFIAVDAGKVVGFMIVAKIWRSSLLNAMNHGTIHDAGVAQAARRNGVGARLLEAVETWFRAEGMQAITVGYAVNNPMSSAFWSKNGYRTYRVNAVKQIN